MTKEQQAEGYKEKANSAYGAGRYQEAIELYTQAINLVPSAIYYSNRAACHLKLHRWRFALEDTSRAVEIDPAYTKGKARHVEALIKLGRGDEALRYAQEVYNAENSTKHHNLLDEAQKCQNLTCGIGNRFEDHLNGVAISLAQKWIGLAGNVARKETLLYATEDRHSNEEKDDAFNMDICEVTETISNIRESVGAAYTQLTNDYRFHRTVMLGYKIDPLLFAYYNLLLKALKDFCILGNKVGMDPYPGQETDDKGNALPLPNYVELAKRDCGSSGDKQSVEYKLITAILMISNDAQPDQVTSALNQAAQADSQAGRAYGVAQLAAGYPNYIRQKEQGSNLFKANKFREANELFRNSLESLLQPSLLNSDKVKGVVALFFLAVRSAAASMSSNIGMSFNKMNSNGYALSYLRASTILDPEYCKGHIRAANIYKEQKMYLECIRECGMAVSIDEKEAKGCQELAKSCQSGAEKFARPDYYRMLGIKKGIDPNSQEYASAYKKSCLKWHPDRHRDPVKKRFAQLKFRQLQEADEVLKNPQKRQIYDAGGNPAGSSFGGGGGEGMSFDMSGMGIDISQVLSMFGMGGMSGRRGNVTFQVHRSSGGPASGMGIDLSQIFRGM